MTEGEIIVGCGRLEEAVPDYRHGINIQRGNQLVLLAQVKVESAEHAREMAQLANELSRVVMEIIAFETKHRHKVAKGEVSPSGLSLVEIRRHINEVMGPYARTLQEAALEQNVEMERTREQDEMETL